MRALVLAAAVSCLAAPAFAASICTPTATEQARVMDTMTRVQNPDLASLATNDPTLAGCGVWTLEVAADGHVASLEAMRVQGDPKLRGVVEPWLKTLKFAPQPQDWTGIIPVTLEGSGKK